MEYGFPIDSLEEVADAHSVPSNELTDGEERDSVASLDQPKGQPSTPGSVGGAAAVAAGGAASPIPPPRPTTTAAPPMIVTTPPPGEDERPMRRDYIGTADENSSISSSPRVTPMARGGNSSGALSARANVLASPGIRRHPSAQTLVQDRRRAATAGKPPPEERMGFARIYFENQNFTSSTVFKLYGTTTVLEVRASVRSAVNPQRIANAVRCCIPPNQQVRKSMANKIKIPLSDFEYYVIVVVFPTECA